MKAVISGYGKMGRMVEKVLLEKGIECAGKSENITDFDRNIARECVCIDFTVPEAFRANYRFLAENFKAVVVGTTGWNDIKDEVIAEDQLAQRLQERTLDFVSTGEQQSDAGHVLQGDFEKGSYSGEFYVDALSGKWFSYMLATQGTSENVSLMCRYHTADAGRVYTLSVNQKASRDSTTWSTRFPQHGWRTRTGTWPTV